MKGTLVPLLYMLQLSGTEGLGATKRKICVVDASMCHKRQGQASASPQEQQNRIYFLYLDDCFHKTFFVFVRLVNFFLKLIKVFNS